MPIYYETRISTYTTKKYKEKFINWINSWSSRNNFQLTNNQSKIGGIAIADFFAQEGEWQDIWLGVLFGLA